jgi:DNA-binding NarL/FixJ family response regulator
MGARSLLIYHPQRLIREIWTSFLSSREFINVIGNADNFEDLISLATARHPRICIAWVNLGHLSDLCGLAALRKANASTKIILVCPTYPAAVGTLLTRIGIEGDKEGT